MASTEAMRGELRISCTKHATASEVIIAIIGKVVDQIQDSVSLPANLTVELT